MRKKRWMSIMLVLCMILTLLPINTAYADEADTQKDANQVEEVQSDEDIVMQTEQVEEVKPDESVAMQDEQVCLLYTSSYTYLCGIFRKKSNRCKDAEGKNYDWIRSLFS